MKDIQRASSDTMAQSRYNELKKMLDDRRAQLQAEVQEKMRDVRTDGFGGKLTEVLDAVESSEADIQEDIEFALIQMKSETLTKIHDALARLERGDYGYCFECGEEIAEKHRQQKEAHVATAYAARKPWEKQFLNVKPCCLHISDPNLVSPIA